MANYEELDKIKTTVITEKELQKIKNQKLMEFYGQIETINAKSNNLGTYELFFGDYKEMFEARKTLIKRYLLKKRNGGRSPVISPKRVEIKKVIVPQ